MLRLSLPVLAEEMMTLAVTWTDWWLTGHYIPGDPAKAAMGVMGYVMWIFPTFFASLAIGGTALVARHIGAGDQAAARKVANQALAVGVALATLIVAITWLFGQRLVSLTQLEGQSYEMALQYFWCVVPALPFIMVSQIGAACLRGAGDTFSGFAAKSIVVILNIFFSVSLVTGWGPFPEMGWQGVALGTAIGHGLGGTLIGALLLFGRAGLGLSPARMRPDMQVIRPLLKIGLPGGFDMLTIVMSQFVYIAIINALGDGAAAAHGLAVQIESLAWMPGAAFQVAAATLAGQFLGAGRPQQAASAVRVCLWTGGTLITCSGILIYFCANWFTWFFTGSWEDPTSQMTTSLLRIIAYAMPALAVLMILSGALRGAGDTRWTLAISSFGFFAIRIPLALWWAWEQIPLGEDLAIPGLGWGIEGAWYAMAADLFIRAGLVVGRFVHGGWQHVRV